ncbi:2-amino-4-hydroxy-6-hydroxymethyldihydropteridine diphosphokinase [uncultured Thiohalocapsa sp.]|uniref:2-amino-4-hydroxy-6- hydroxymethyldihydropteridine diphosphokinase n=1 Tax=uncultured Thiohalocapsa sp. TaxID=768990 RepID=UPI0025D018F0|nr:2-amino-4-hydroxy-6-hydroxymethyldihydropteridine diphosphokinase [uncultured Thiohalocapsa sp.]
MSPGTGASPGHPADAPRRCWISVGSNVRREPSIRGAVADLRRQFGPVVVSPVYETEAVGFEGEAFYNLVAGIDTRLGVAALNRMLRAIEDAHGRVRGPNKFAPRTLDLDLLTWGGAADTIDGCELPRDEILKYAFVLAPLADVAPRECHPVDGRTYAELWAVMAPMAQPLVPVTLEPPL